MEKYDVRFRLNEGKELPALLSGKWQETLVDNNVKYTNDKATIVFLSEMLSILDDDNKCEFDCKLFGAGGMMGGLARHWKLTTGNLSIKRDFEQEINDSWQSVDISENTLEINGFIRETKLIWKTRHEDDFTSNLDFVLKSIGKKQKDSIIKLANSLYNEIETEVYDYAPRQSKNFKRFEKDFFGKSKATEHICDNLKNLSNEEKLIAEAMLVDYIEDSGFNDKIIDGLVAIMSQKAKPVLQDLFFYVYSGQKLKVCVALEKIQKESVGIIRDYKYEILKILKSDLITEEIRDDAVEALANLVDSTYFRYDDMVAELHQVITDKDYKYEIKAGACNSLLKLHGIDKPISHYKNIHQLIKTPKEKSRPAIPSADGKITNTNSNKNDSYYQKASNMLKELLPQKK